MKQCYLLTLLACLCRLSSPAQDLVVNSDAYNRSLFKSEPLVGSHQKVPHSKPRVWKKEHDQVNGHIDHTLLKAMEKTTAAIVGLLKDSCLSAVPTIPGWHGEFFSGVRNLPSPLKFGLECQFQLPVPPDSTGAAGNVVSPARIGVLANDITPLFKDTLAVNGKIFQTLIGPSMIKNGCTYFQIPTAGEGKTPEEGTPDGRSENTKFWLVTTDPDKLPYIPVTRREYLEEAIKEVKADKEEIIAAIKERTPVRPADKQKAEKEMEMDQIRQTYSGVEADMRVRSLLQSYKSDEDYLKEGIDKGTLDVEATLHLMDSLLTRLPAAELKKPAIVSAPAANFVAFEDSLSGHTMLVQANAAYFDPTVTGEKPQYFLVCWKYSPIEPAAADIDRLLSDTFDFKKLQGLLGK